MRKNLLHLSLIAVLLMVSAHAWAWTIDFTALGAKYVDKTGVTISPAVVANVGTCSIVDGTLQTPIEIEGADPQTTDSDILYGNFTLQSGSSWLVRPGGLYSANGGGRALGILNCKKDQNITIAISIAPTLSSSNAELKNSENGVYVYTVTEDGDVLFTITRYSYITSIAVNWEIDFSALGAKYVDKTGVTISPAVVANVGTCSIVDGTLQTPIEVEEGDPVTTASDVLDPSFTLQSGSSWLIRPGGLYSANGGGRSLGILNCKKDQAITMAINIAPTVSSGNAELKSSEDGVYVYTVTEDGNVIFSITRYSYITRIAVGDVAGVEYTVKFVNENGDPLKEDAVHKGEVGTVPVLTATDIAPLYLEGIKYVVKSNDAESQLIKEDGSTVVTVVMAEATKYDYRVRLFFNDGEGANGTRINNPYWDGKIYDGDKVTVHYPIAYKHPTSGKWYISPVVGSYQGRNVTITGQEPDGSRILADVKYELVDSIAYAGEFEDNAAMTLTGTVASWTGWGDILYNNSESILESNTAFTDDHMSFWRFDRFSNGAGPRLTEGSYFTINEPFAEEGAYQVSIYCRNGSSSTNERPGLYILAPNSEELKKATSSEIGTFGGAVMGYLVVENVMIPAGAKLVVMNDSEANNVDFDHISITKTGEYSDITAIKNVDKVQNTGVIYNLAGQKVSNSFKGIVVKDGRKMIKK